MGERERGADPLDGERMPVARVTPVLEDLFFDEALSDVDRITRYGRSALPLQRLVHARQIAATAAREGCVGALAPAVRASGGPPLPPH